MREILHLQIEQRGNQIEENQIRGESKTTREASVGRDGVRVKRDYERA